MGYAMLELKSLLIGLVFVLGVFAAKTGAGLTYFVTQRRPVWRKIAVLLGIAAGYFAIFHIAWLVCSRVDVIFYFNRLRALFQSGMVLHFITAVGMFVWGTALLRRHSKDAKHGSWGWLPLVFPCPVCGSVIFVTTGFLVSFFPEYSLGAVLGAYTLFVVITLVTVTALSILSRAALWRPEQALAFSMLFIASYFLLSMLLTPHFSDMDKVYRIAAFHSSQGSVDPKELLGLLTLAVLAISTGFFMQRLRQRSVR
jgi:predicted transporter